MIMNGHQSIQRDGHVCQSALRAPLLPVSRVGPAQPRCGLRQCRGAKAFGTGRKCAKSIIRAAAEPEVQASETATGIPTQNENMEGNWVPVCKPEEVPKGYRFEAKAAGVDVLLLWYRNQMYAIEQRSPAAGAYSEGFVNSKLTQEYEIECPDTKSKFSLKTGEVTDWYPTNPVLRAITPKDTVRPMDIFPVKLTQDAIMVDVSGAATTKFQGAGRGGSDTSIDANNVFALQPRTYLEGSGPDDVMEMGSSGSPKKKIDPYVLAITIFTYACLAVAGTAVALYAESFVGLGIFWVALLGITGAYVLNYLKEEENAAR
ncbi:hypothetical protein CVIRNUC_007387 [Coccomyxa viridis]|uniref:Rieske-like [2Fe-2S] domain-containing protein n=1 Tax=Coccomyxa viridis TaxID=1274662 RepID=A0AAV1IE68_9CHLO|nr:hypothetical protein CVIRNUC_007387 [Coccomyxa viridis]